MNIFIALRRRIERVMALSNPIKYARKLGVRIADDVQFTGIPNYGTEPWLISIGNKCLITQNVRFMTHDGAVNIIRRLDSKYSRIEKFGKIVIGENCFIGANSMIMPSVQIGANSIIAACSCVTKDVPAGEVWGGVPAKRICSSAEMAGKLFAIQNQYLDFEYKDNKEFITKIADVYWTFKHKEINEKQRNIHE